MGDSYGRYGSSLHSLLHGFWSRWNLPDSRTLPLGQSPFFFSETGLLSSDGNYFFSTPVSGCLPLFFHPDEQNMNLKVVSSSESDNETFHFKAIFFWFECIWIAIQEDDWYRGIPFENLTFLQLAAWPFIRQQLNPSAAKIAWSYFYSDVIHDIQVGNPTSDETFHFTNYFWSPLYLSYDRFSDSDFAIWIWFLKEARRFSRGPWTIQMKRSPGKRHPVWTDLDLEKPNSGLYQWSASFQFRSGHLNLSSHLIWTGVPILTSSTNVVSFTIRSLGERIGKELCSLFSMNRPVFQISRNPHPSACWMVPDGTYSVCCSENKTERKIAEFYFSCPCCFWLLCWFVIRFR